MATNLVNTADTLSINTVPGQDIRFPTTNSESLFTFGSFRLEQDVQPDVLTGGTFPFSFSPFSNLESLKDEEFGATEILNTNVNELNLKSSDPNSYSYFGSFYTKVSIAINNIIDTFPYAMLAYNNGISSTIFDYSGNSISLQSTFKIPVSVLTNQGRVIYSSGVTEDEGVLTLFNDFDKFGIQFSGNSANTTVYKILEYSYTTGSSGHLSFTVDGLLFTGSTASSTDPVYIRPSEGRFGNFKKTTSNLENQLLFKKKLLVPTIDDDDFEEREFEWPKTIDGFNPDTYGSEFENYKDSLLEAARLIDDSKTNILIRTMVPENLLNLDSDNLIYKKLLGVYSHEFDTIKQYIDGLAYAHTIDYKEDETIPEKFIPRLARLLGWDLKNAFQEVDLFEYLARDVDGGEKSLSDYNTELWRKILTNINWLYKKKGTRDSLMFIFKLLSVPDCLVNLNEFVYKINRTVQEEIALSGLTQNPKINDNGYIDYTASQYIFQEGGEGRGNGKRYITQWNPEFKPIRTIDNIKIHTGDTSIFGSEDTINSKELCLSINPACAIEQDVKEWYELGYGWWLWGSTHVSFSALTVPFFWQIEDVNKIAPPAISGMTVWEWADFIFASNVNPRGRKVYPKSNGVPGRSIHNSIYHNMKRIYITYFLWSGNASNRLTFGKLENFLSLVELTAAQYVPQILPATTILTCEGTTYKNTIFNIHKYVYKEGINDGSEFQVEHEDRMIFPDKNIIFPKINLSTGNDKKANVVSVSTIGGVGNNIKVNKKGVNIKMEVIESINVNIKGVNSNANAFDQNSIKTK